jgi:eukaryotic-like serine/threonine-protein kinase
VDREHRWSADQWKAISPYLDQALDLEPQVRSAWLDQLAAANPALADDLRELLATHDKVSSAQFLDRALLSPAPDPVAGQQFGAYTLESLIGSGGMGSVWRAKRSDGHFEARVAIKILDHGGLGHQGADQVRREASLLARQSHSNIARLFDAGFTADGQAYLILEFVEGLRIDEYCDSNALSLDARLALLLPVIDAVAHAHTQGIVHRDLKPSNILVTADGVPKLLDFGVAALISRSATLTTAAISKTTPLDAGPEQISLGMTPAYAAPEQIRGEEVTPASDVYALGILLHLLITGRHPFAADTSTHTQIIRAVLTEDAALASEGVDSPSSRRWLRGDLDAVIAKASQREPENRYPSADEFAADIRRFRAARPVLARRHSWSQHIGMFARRNRVHFLPMLSGLLIALIVAAAVLWKLSNAKLDAAPRRVVAPERSVAVMPFLDMSEKKDQEYFSDGLSQELIDQLTKVPDLTVSPRTSSFYFKNRGSTIEQIAKALGVSAVLEGSVRRFGDKLRISAQLVKANDSHPIWSETYDRNIDNIFEIQSEISGAVVKALKASLPGVATFDEGGTRDVRANDLFFHAIFLYNQHSDASVAEALSDLRESVALDPNFARGWAMLSRIQFATWFNLRPDDSRRAAIALDARRSAATAVNLAPQLAAGHIVSGRLAQYADGDLITAEREYRRALELAPRNSYALIQLGYIEGAKGRYQEQNRLADLAVALDPLDSATLDTSAFLAYHSGDLPKAELLFRRLRDVAPSFSIVQSELGKVLLARGHAEVALAEFERAPDPDDVLLGRALAYRALNREADSEAALGRLEASHTVDPYKPALVYGYMGNADKTFEWLERQMRVDSDFLVRMRVLDDPLLDNVKEDPRYQAMRRELKIR